MNTDFHYGVIYVMSQLAGMCLKDAQTVAHS